MSQFANREHTGPRMTIKTRMSLWFTIVLAAICMLLLAVTAAAYGEYGKQVARSELTSAVKAEAKALEEEHDLDEKIGSGELKDADFSKGGVQLMMYDEDGGRYAGLFLHDGLDDVSLSNSDKIRKVTLDGDAYYCYDERVRVPRGKDLWVRGIVRAETSVWDMLARSGFLAWLIPALLIVAFFGGRLLAGRFLRPVREIDRAARDIRESGDLARRVPVGKSGDELSALAEDMNEMLDTLERSFEAERAFTSSASHELRTPIAVILAECEYAEENATGEEELRESIVAMHKQGMKMSGIVESLLLLTRMEQGTERYTREPLDLSALARSTCDDFAAMAQNAHVQRTIADDVVATANRELMELAVDNLLRNAERYGGTDVEIRVTLTCRDGKARITVGDNGPGIPDDELGRVWDLFYRADASRSTEGLGIGLPLVRRIAEYHGGTAFAESCADPAESGATFVIELPASVQGRIGADSGEDAD